MMKLPKTAKGYLKLLIAIAEDTSDNASGWKYIGDVILVTKIRAMIQNELGDNQNILKEFDLKYKG